MKDTLRHSFKIQWKPDLAIDARPRLRHEGFLLIPYLKVTVHSRQPRPPRTYAYAQTATKTERDRESDIRGVVWSEIRSACIYTTVRCIEKFTRIKSAGYSLALTKTDDTRGPETETRSYVRFYKRGLTLKSFCRTST